MSQDTKPAAQRPQIDVTKPLVDGGKTIGELIMDLLMGMEQLRLDFNNIASPENNAFLDLVIARLSHNDAFMHKLAQHIHQVASESAARRNTPPAADALPEGVIRAGDGTLVALTSEITTGHFAFSGNEGYVEIVLNETGEEVADGTIFYTGAEPRALDLYDRKDSEILIAVASKYRQLTTSDPPVNVAAGDKIWFQVSKWWTHNSLTGEPYPERLQEPTKEDTDWTLTPAPEAEVTPSQESDQA